MFEIKSITSVAQLMLETAVAGYNSSHRFSVSRKETAEGITFSLSR